MGNAFHGVWGYVTQSGVGFALSVLLVMNDLYARGNGTLTISFAISLMILSFSTLCSGVLRPVSKAVVFSRRDSTHTRIPYPQQNPGQHQRTCSPWHRRHRLEL